MQTIIEPHETALVKKIVQKDWVCLDIGANVGYYTVLLAGLCKQVYAFEPEPINYITLEFNVRNCQNVKTENVIVSDIDGLKELYLCIGNYDGARGMHRIYKSKWCSDMTYSVPSVSMDVFMLGRIKPDFIKMDIEGSEMGALKGMLGILKTYHPKMLIEFHPPAIEEYGANPEEEYHFLKTLGYKIELVPNIEITSYQQLDKLTRDDTGGRNIFCQ